MNFVRRCLRCGRTLFGSNRCFFCQPPSGMKDADPDVVALHYWKASSDGERDLDAIRRKCEELEELDRQLWIAFVGDYEGLVFAHPFRCLCCGRRVSSRQFAFGSMCGRCDSGACGNRPCDRDFQVNVRRFIDGEPATVGIQDMRRLRQMQVRRTWDK